MGENDALRGAVRRVLAAWGSSDMAQMTRGEAMHILRAAYKASEPEPAEPEYVEVPVTLDEFGYSFKHPGDGDERWLENAQHSADFCGYAYKRDDGTSYVSESPRCVTCRTYRRGEFKDARVPFAVLFKMVEGKE